MMSRLVRLRLVVLVSVGHASALQVGMAHARLAPAVAPSVRIPLTTRVCQEAQVRMVASEENPSRQPTAVYALILANLLAFVGDKILRLPFTRSLYQFHGRVAWWQPLTACFMHADRAHLSGNLFLLLLVRPPVSIRRPL